MSLFSTKNERDDKKTFPIKHTKTISETLRTDTDGQFFRKILIKKIQEKKNIL